MSIIQQAPARLASVSEDLSTKRKDAKKTRGGWPVRQRPPTNSPSSLSCDKRGLTKLRYCFLSPLAYLIPGPGLRTQTLILLLLRRRASVSGPSGQRPVSIAGCPGAGACPYRPPPNRSMASAWGNPKSGRRPGGKLSPGVCQLSPRRLFHYHEARAMGGNGLRAAGAGREGVGP